MANLSQGLFRQHLHDHDGLMRGLVVLPTRRSKRLLASSLQKQSPRSGLLLPTIAAVDDLPRSGPAQLAQRDSLGDLSGALIAARLLEAASKAQSIGALPTDRAFRLGRDLFRLLDLLAEYDVDWEKLQTTIPDHLSVHWQNNLAFLSIVIEHWPDILASQGKVMPSTGRNLSVQTFVDDREFVDQYAWICLAGLKPGNRATRSLLSACGHWENASVVTQGVFPTSLDITTPLPPTHPQFEHQKVLELSGLIDTTSSPWSGASASSESNLRTRFMLKAVAPETSTEQDALPAQALNDLHFLDARDPAAEALGIALLMRERLNMKRPDGAGQTAMLIAPDRTLARRVALELRRFRISLDESAGTPLDQTAAGGFLLLVAHVMADGPTPVRLLELLKHPLTGSGGQRGKVVRAARDLDKDIFRCPEPPATFDGLIDQFAGTNAIQLDPDSPDAKRLERRLRLRTWLCTMKERLEQLLGDLDPNDTTLPDILRAHLAFAEWFAADAGYPSEDEGEDDDSGTGSGGLWEREAGEAAADLCDSLRNYGHDLGPVALSAYPALLATMMADIAVRKRFSGHPRLSIVGQVESRLSSADIVILGGLNEGVWPRHIDTGPWLNLAMRKELGLPDLTEETGRSAHDLMMGLNARSVVFSRSLKDHAGKPTVESPLLARLKATIQTMDKGQQLIDERTFNTDALTAYDRPEAVKPMGEPMPTPPLAARPVRFRTTEVGTWVSDPYAIYARKILGLEQLEALAGEPGAKERGLIFHAALESFVRSFPDRLPTNVLDHLLTHGEKPFGPLAHIPEVSVLWFPRFREAMRRIVEEEQSRRGDIIIHPEISASWHYTSSKTSRHIELRCKADRIEQNSQGDCVVIDYKTGKPPTKSEITSGFYPQLVVEAMMLRNGDFKSLGQRQTTQLEYWHLKGKIPHKDELVTTYEDFDKVSIDEQITITEKRIQKLIERYEDPLTPYPSLPFGNKYASPFNNFDHLARRGEWLIEDDESDKS